MLWSVDNKPRNHWKSTPSIKNHRINEKILWSQGCTTNCLLSEGSLVPQYFTYGWSLIISIIIWQQKVPAAVDNLSQLDDDLSWYITINHDRSPKLIMKKSPIIIKGHRKTPNVMKIHHVKWDIFDYLWWSHKFWSVPKLDHQRSWKTFHFTWWFLVINHDQSWFSHFSWERKVSTVSFKSTWLFLVLKGGCGQLLQQWPIITKMNYGPIFLYQIISLF